MVTNSTPNIFVAGFLLTTSICRFLIFFVFHKKPNQRLYCTVSTINRLSRFICVPVNCPSGVAHPCNSKYGSTISTHRKTVVTVSPGKYTTLSRTVARNSLIVSIWVVVTRSNSRFLSATSLSTPHRSPGIFQTLTISVPKPQLWRRSNYLSFGTGKLPAITFPCWFCICPFPRSTY